MRAGGAGELAGLMIGDYITEVNGLDTGATTFGIPLVRFCPRTRRCRSSCASHASCKVWLWEGVRERGEVLASF